MSQLPADPPRCDVKDASEPELDLVIASRPRDLGGFMVRRLLPAPKCRAVGSFVFLDEMGPATFAPGQGLDVRPHPHIHLATLTYLLEGEIMHRDSLGSAQVIRPGAVNWMCAGRGIVHSERTPEERRTSGATLHGLQFWVALPRDHEDTEPHFTHLPASSLPTYQAQGVTARVIAGTFQGRTSPLQTLASIVLVDLQLEGNQSFSMERNAPEEAVYVIEGRLQIGDEVLEAGQLGVLSARSSRPWIAQEATRAALLGGMPLDAPRAMWWNFVSSDPERIEQAKDDWAQGRFATVPGDETEFIPLPAS